MITLSKRLEAITEMVTPISVAADIGCDHCLTLMRLLETGACKEGIGSDVKRGPLEKARENLKKHGYAQNVDLRMGNGLSTIKSGEADAIIISGMGGGLVNDILSEGLTVARSAAQLVIQPQNDVCAVRKRLHDLGFTLADERMVYEQGKFYTVIKAVVGEEKYQEQSYYLYGKALIHRRDGLLGEYLRQKLAENDKIALPLRGKNSENCALRLAEIENENNIIREVLACL